MEITSSGSVATFRLAGELGANLLTHLLGQDPDELAVKIAEYRAAGGRHVTLMLHTFVGPDDHGVREAVRDPMCAYLKNSFDLVAKLAATTGDDEFDMSELDESDVDFLVQRAGCLMGVALLEGRRSLVWVAVRLGTLRFVVRVR